MGQSASVVEHDPGAPGPEGEGEATLFIFALIFALSVLVTLYKNNKAFENFCRSNPAIKWVFASSAAENSTDADLEKASDETSDVVKPAATEDAVFSNEGVNQLGWLEPPAYNVSPEWVQKVTRIISFGSVDAVAESGADGMTPKEGASMSYQVCYFIATLDYPKLVLMVFATFLIFAFLLSLMMMGTGFKLLGGKDSAKMFDVVDNPISGLMVGILVTVLVQSSSTSTSIIIALVGADELSVSNAIPMIMGANIGTSVTNTIVAMAHFANRDDLTRGFAAATVHDCFNLLTVAIMLPLNWASGFLDEMTYEMAKDAEACDESAGDQCDKQEFIKPFLSPYVKAVAAYDKKVSKYVAEGYCNGQCGYKASGDERALATAALCPKDEDGDFDCSAAYSGFKRSWFDGESDTIKSKRLPAYALVGGDDDVAASLGDRFIYECPEALDCENAPSLFEASSLDENGVFHSSIQGSAPHLFEVCPASKFKDHLCDKRLLKGGLFYDWGMSDEGAGVLCTILSLLNLCCCIFLIIVVLQRLVKGTAAKFLQKALNISGYLSIVIGMIITILVQSSSITTATLTPLAAVGIITLEQMYPLTLGANIGTTVTGILAATVVTSNPVAGWQGALSHLFFNIFGILIWYPIPYMRQIPLNSARMLGKLAWRFGPWFPLSYILIVFFAIPAIAYGIAHAATE